MIIIKNKILKILLTTFIFIYININYSYANNLLNISKKAKIIPEVYILKTPVLYQLYPNFYPNGCECFSEYMGLSLKGIKNIIPQTLINEINNATDPREGFIGNMKSIKYFNGTVPTVWPERIIKQVKQYRPNSYYSNSLTIEQIENEIANNNPIMLWYSWVKVNVPLFTANGIIFSSKAFHCTLLVGYDKNNWYFNDPGLGKFRKLDKNIFYKKYVAYGMKSVVIK